MKSLSLKASKVCASTTLAVDTLAKKMQAEGQDVVNFGAGEPDFDTPDHIKQAGIRAINEGKTKYTPAAGLVPLREAVCTRLKEDCGLTYGVNEITVASGAKHNVFIALCALLNPGDEVILPAPYWLSYIEMIKMAGGEPVVITAEEQAEFKITSNQIEAAVTEKTKAIILNNPSNPTGMLYSRAELEAIAQACVKHDLYVISDEIYNNLVYDNREFVSFASLGEDVKQRTLLINGVSKTYAMTGWRIGYTAANAEISKVMSNYLSHSTGAPGTMCQLAAAEAFAASQESVVEMRKVFEKRRNHLVSRMNTIPGVSCIMPNAAFYVMMNIEKIIGRTLGGHLIQNGDDFALAFLEKGLVAVIPCSGFGAPNFVRWTYSVSMENIDKGLDRLEAFLKG